MARSIPIFVKRVNYDRFGATVELPERPNGCTCSAGAGHVQTKPEAARIDRFQPPWWLKVPIGLETHRRGRGEVGRTDLLAAAFLRLACLHGPRMLAAWICVKERCAYLDSGPSCALSPAWMQSSRRPPMRCGESESIVETVGGLGSRATRLSNGSGSGAAAGARGKHEKPWSMPSCLCSPLARG